MAGVSHKRPHADIELPFGASGLGFLRWLPDETLFSLASRYHRLSGQLRAEHTCRALFGGIRGGLAHDLPDSIDAFVERTQRLLGRDAETVIRQHTLLPFYLPFRPAAGADAAVAALRSPGIGSLKFRLGMLTSRFRAHHPLKVCPRCLGEDVESVYVAYWHLAHQYPGVWFCIKHDEVLLQSTLKSSGVGRFHWHLPDATKLVGSIIPPAESRQEEALRSLLRRFAVAAHGLARMPRDFHFDPECLVRTHRRQMIDQGLVKPSGQMAVHAASSLADLLQPLARVPELAALAVSADKAPTQFSYLRDPARALTHPLRHIGHVLWLYGSWTAFVAAYQRHVNLPSQDLRGARHLPGDKVPSPSDPRCLAFLDLVLRQQFAVTRAARQVGVDAKTGMAWAARAGIASNRRPKKLVPAVHQRLAAALRRGCDKRVAADRFGVSVETVTTMLRTEVGLHEDWKRARLESRRRAERRAWQRLVRGNPGAGMKALRWMASATYAWLYRNDRAWLVSQADLSVPTRRCNNAAVNWQARDLALSAAVLKAGASLVAEAPEQRITLWRLYQRVPAIKPKLRYLDRLPMTRAAVEHAIQHRASPKGTRSLV
jgi:hypothetical protein